MQRRVENGRWFLAFREIIDDAHHVVDRAGEHHVGRAGNVRCEESLRVGQDRIIGRGRLDTEDVESGRRKVTALQRCAERRFIDQYSAVHIDDDRAVFHRSQDFGIDEVLILLATRRAHDDVVGVANGIEEFVGRIGIDAVGRALGVDVRTA